jgi:hypothetical protein
VIGCGLPARPKGRARARRAERMGQGQACRTDGPGPGVSNGWDSAFVQFSMMKFLLWLVLLFFCWPLALIALVLYPFVWLVLLPFRLVGIAFEGVFELLRAIMMLPARVLGGGRR